MLDWILRHASGLLDWLLVWLFVTALVLGCQFMINFLKMQTIGAALKTTELTGLRPIKMQLAVTIPQTVCPATLTYPFLIW